MMIEKIRKQVREACAIEGNFFGYGSWEYHIVPAVKYAKLLAKKLKADREIVEVATLLHDYAGIINKDWWPKHHLLGAELAEKILKKYNYPKAKVEEVKHCILAHRASKKIPRRTIEAKIVADADALAHFNNAHSLLHLVFVQYKMGIDEGTKWVLDKLGRDWKKLTFPESKGLIRGKYKAIKEVLTARI